MIRSHNITAAFDIPCTLGHDMIEITVTILCCVFLTGYITLLSMYLLLKVTCYTIKLFWIIKGVKDKKRREDMIVIFKENIKKNIQKI